MNKTNALISALRSPSFGVVVLGVGIIAVMLLGYVAQPTLVRQLDAKTYDMLLPLARRGHISSLPLIVDIDEKSLAHYGQWPWSRLLLARLIDELAASGVAAIGLDILLAEADRSSPLRIQHDVQRDTGITLTLGEMPPHLRDYDTLLAELLAEMPVVLGAYASTHSAIAPNAQFPPGVSFFLHEQPGAAPALGNLPSIGAALLPLPGFWKAAPVGFLNMAPDADGIVRRLPLLFTANNTLYPSLALGTLMQGFNVNSLILGAEEEGLAYIRMGNHTIPVSPQGYFMVPFQGKRKTYPYISAMDVLEGTVPKDFLQGRIVFVGTSAAGLMDLRATPFDRVFPGVEVHAAAVDSILSGQYITEPSWKPGLHVVLIVVCGAIAALAFGFTRPIIYISVAATLLATVVAGAIMLFLHGHFISPLYAAATIIAQGIVLLFLRFWQEERQKSVLRNAFSRYVSPEVVRRIARLQGDIFAGEEKELSILFTDIRGFTTLAEGLNPRQTVLLLNRYFTPMTKLVRESGGTVDKFIGDALMAFWNAPLDVPQHPRHAVNAALAMQETLCVLNEELQKDFGLRLAMGVGIHTGKAYVGNMGSEDVMNYTLIGDAVNLASRLEGLCPKYGCGVVVSGATKAACGQLFIFQQLDTITVKGKSLPVDIYTPMRPEQAEACRQELQAWQEVRALYTAGAFLRAAELCSSLQQIHPTKKLYALYTERCRELAAEPPQEWNGVWALTSK